MAFDPHVPEIAGVIQLAIAPVFMLTAVGTVIGALNIRLGRAVDRIFHIDPAARAAVIWFRRR